MKDQYYLFDFDGVLVDSMAFWAGIHIKALEDAGIPVPEDFVTTITPLGNYNACKYTISLGLDVQLDDYLDQTSRILYEAYSAHIHLKSHVKETLICLKESGAHINVLTASPHLYADICLKRHGIYDLFENVWTIEDFDLTKDQPEIYVQAARRLDVPTENCTMVDDNLKVIITANAAGIHTIGVYDHSARDQEDSMRRNAERYITDFSQL